ncbi:MAG: DNA translocase FtsK 4TM domain-containing protein [Lentisphaerae bacterium]|nr:DNA translocase FtsK 4TM domain-containing protein [Lentisphaerota bacterium]
MGENKNSIAEDEDVKEQGERQGGFCFKYVFVIIVFLLLLLSVLSHSASDLAVLEGGNSGAIKNWIGPFGAHFARISFYLFGLATYPIFFLLIICAFRPLLHHPTRRRGYAGSIIAVIVGITILFAMWPEKFVTVTNYLGIGSENAPLSALSGGVIGQKLAAPEMSVAPGLITRNFGTVGSLIVALVFLVSGSVFIWISDWQSVFASRRREDEDETNSDLEDSIDTLSRKREEALEKKYGEYKKKFENKEKEKEELPLAVKSEETDISKKQTPELSRKKPVPVKPSRRADPMSQYALPPVTLLEKGKEVEGEAQNFIDASKKILQSTLDSFGIQGKVISYVSGPRVTRYEISLDPGVKVERISSLSNNFAMDLQAESVRILAPIPGKNTVGIEVPNSKVSFISIRSIMESGPWNAPNVEIPIILGRDVSGRPVVTDLARAPHLLIAGATGSGKSVCMHSLIMSLLYRFTPNELKLIMVDPKMVEFSMYASLPHLITPVVTDSKKVPVALHWGVNEMERRYKIFSKAKSKKLSDFNRREKKTEIILDDDGIEIPDKLPVLVIIIDELADIMMSDAKASVENSIARIAQKGRAAGIHMVVATQTPRKQIITGVIKANLPARIAFQVSSIVDSGVILDRKGAEKLLGRGDMLFIPPGSSSLDRIQGSLVSDKEIEKVVTFVSEQAEQLFDETVLSGNATELAAELPIGEGGEGEDGDLFSGDSEEDLLERAIQAVLTDGKASTSYVQRRLGVGYNKAANLIEIMEKKGIVGPPMGASAKREILVSRENYLSQQ